jgi:hypothetical protein
MTNIHPENDLIISKQTNFELILQQQKNPNKSIFYNKKNKIK